MQTRTLLTGFMQNGHALPTGNNATTDRYATERYALYRAEARAFAREDLDQPSGPEELGFLYLYAGQP